MKILLVIAALAMGVSVAQAQNAPKQKKQSLHDQFSGQGYGTAGCGLGSIVFGDAPGMVQIVAATVNMTGYQTSAITTGTSNCGDSGKTARANQFIEVNKVSLENDLARGTGETVSALGEVMGCHNSDFSTTLRRSYSVGSSNEQLAQAADQACKL